MKVVLLLSYIGTT